MSSHNLQELLRGAGLHIGLTDTTCGLVIILWVRKSPMMVRRPEQLCAEVEYDGHAGWPSYAIWQYDGQPA